MQVISVSPQKYEVYTVCKKDVKEVSVLITQQIYFILFQLHYSIKKFLLCSFRSGILHSINLYFP